MVSLQYNRSKSSTFMPKFVKYHDRKLKCVLKMDITTILIT